MSKQFKAGKTFLWHIVNIYLLVLCGTLIWVPSFAGDEIHDRQDLLLILKQAQSAFRVNETEKALVYLKDAKIRAESMKDYLASAAIMNQMGNVYEQLGEYQQGLKQYEKGLQMLELQQAKGASIIEDALTQLRGRNKGYTGPYGAPISTDLYKGQIADFNALLNQSSDVAEKEVAVLLAMNAGNLYLAQTQNIQAKILYNKALEIAKASGLHLKSRQIYSNLAWSEIKQGQFAEAEKWLKAALDERDEIAPPVELRRAFLAVGVAFREEKKYGKAIAQLEEAVALYEIAEDPQGKGHALAHLATAWLQKGELKKAEERYLQALMLNQQVQDKNIGWHAHGGLGKTYSQSGNLAAAVEQYHHYFINMEGISRNWYTDEGKVGILENHKAISDEFVQLALLLAKKTGDFSALREGIERVRARALNFLIEGRGNALPKKPGTLSAGPVLYGSHWSQYLKRYQRGSENMANQMALGVTSVDSQRLNQWFEERVGLDTQKLPSKGNQIPDLPSVDPPPVTFLELFVLPSQTVVLVKQPDGKVGGLIVDIDEKLLRNLIDEYRQALKVEKPRGVTLISSKKSILKSLPKQLLSEGELSHRLYKLLIQPIKNLLPPDPQHTIVIVPHNSFWLLPFAALHGENSDFFGNSHVLTYAASEAIWQYVAKRSRIADHRNAHVWVVGNPSMPQAVESCGETISLDQLPGAEKEAIVIAKLFGPHQANLFTGPQADRLRLEAWHANFSVIHLATHGYACSEDPLGSFLVLSDLSPQDLSFNSNYSKIWLRDDARFPVTLHGVKEIQQIPEFPPIKNITYPGILTARTIITDFQLQADLVTLSACQTGLGQLSGEGLIGFTRAFLAAGSRSLLVSLWRVDDHSTETLMVLFYQEYLKHGNKGLALQQAMAETKKQYPEPKYWAGFSLVGLAE